MRGRSGFHTLGMRLRDIVLGRWVVCWTINRPYPALARDAAFQLRSDLLSTALFEGIGTADCTESAGHGEKDRQRLHPFILKSECFNASGAALKRQDDRDVKHGHCASDW